MLCVSHLYSSTHWHDAKHDKTIYWQRIACAHPRDLMGFDVWCGALRGPNCVRHNAFTRAKVLRTHLSRSRRRRWGAMVLLQWRWMKCEENELYMLRIRLGEIVRSVPEKLGENSVYNNKYIIPTWRNRGDTHEILHFCSHGVHHILVTYTCLPLRVCVQACVNIFCSHIVLAVKALTLTCGPCIYRMGNVY